MIYHGRSAHASAMPHRGVNALDGLLLAYQAISNLRQHIRDQERIHGFVTEGGDFSWDSDESIEKSTVSVSELLQLIVSLREYQYA